jgi:uncharacterized protein YndB with AHSA1/START domain
MQTGAGDASRTVEKQEPGRVTVRVTRRFEIPAERVYDAWIDPSLACLWLYSTPSGKIVRCDIDAQVGGRFTITDRRQGEDVEHTGVYKQLERPSRLVFAFSVPKYSAESSRVTVVMKSDEAGGCEMTLTNEDVPEEYGEGTADGWAGLLQKLSAILVHGA